MGIGSNKSRHARHFHFAVESNERIFINFSFFFFSIVPHRHARRQMSQRRNIVFLSSLFEKNEKILDNKEDSLSLSPIRQKEILEILIARNVRIARQVKTY